MVLWAEDGAHELLAHDETPKPLLRPATLTCPWLVQFTMSGEEMTVIVLIWPYELSMMSPSAFVS